MGPLICEYHLDESSEQLLSIATIEKNNQKPGLKRGSFPKEREKAWNMVFTVFIIFVAMTAEKGSSTYELGVVVPRSRTWCCGATFFISHSLFHTLSSSMREVCFQKADGTLDPMKKVEEKLHETCSESTPHKPFSQVTAGWGSSHHLQWLIRHV